MENQEINNFKNLFLERYNSQKTEDVALSRAINAAVQHNRLYNNLNNKQKLIVRNYWRDLLLELKNDFKKKNWSDKDQENHIIALKSDMQKKFENQINFRISHSQKSISVFLKHLWCLNLISTPIHCPVDRTILTTANAPYNQRGWVNVDDIETHKSRIEILRAAAKRDGHSNLAVWELLQFRPQIID